MLSVLAGMLHEGFRSRELAGHGSSALISLPVPGATHRWLQCPPATAKVLRSNPSILTHKNLIIKSPDKSPGLVL